MKLWQAAAFILVLTLSGGARAGLEKAATCDEACVAALSSYAPEYFSRHAPVLAAEPERFEDGATGDAKACPARAGTAPAVFGVMLGAGAIGGLNQLSGPTNDLTLMREVMKERGVSDGFIFAVDGAEATRSGMLGVMRKPLPCLREGDQVVLVFSGWGTVYPYEALGSSEFMAGFCTARAGDETATSICDIPAEEDQKSAYAASLEEAISRVARSWLISAQPTSAYLPGERQHVLIGADSVFDGGTVERLSGVTAAELSNFVTRVRNRGADAILIIDTRAAASGDLYALQLQASAAPVWAAAGSVMIENNGFPPIQDQFAEKGPVALFGAGQFAALYATNVNGQAYEYAQGAEQKPLGALIFRVAEALRADKAVKFRDMALAISRSFAERNAKVESGGEQDPLFQTSSLDLTLLAPRAGVEKKADGGIEIISPAPKRGAAGVEDEQFTVVARYTGLGQARMAIVDGELVPIDANGQFRGDVRDAAGKFTVALRVLGGNYETLATAELKIRDKPAEPVIAVPARRIALVIANDRYDDPAFPPLKTPEADARAVAEVLKARFGFTTRLEGGGAGLDLFLHNAGKAQIQQVLFELRRRLTAEDQLLIYYAGHGENDPDLGAFWVPVDGQQAADYSWIDASEITRELKRMNAASILVISDSCYAGGLSRGGAEPASGAASRERYLAKASRLKARQLMASGGEEPVEDGGGGGHSVFAKALIEALAAMPGEAFTASELFEQKVKPAVIAAANAAVEGQTPGFSRIARAGDEPGSEFVFQPAPPSP